MPGRGFGMARVTVIQMTLLAMVSVIGVACNRQDNRNPESLPTADIVNLEARDFSFVPSELNLKTSAANPAQGIGMVNLGPSSPHNFSIESLGIDVDVEMDGRTLYLPNIFREEGTFEFFCKYHRDQGMSGKIIVSD